MSCSATSNPYKVSLTQGATLTINLTAKDATDALQDLTGASVYFTVRKRIEDATYVIYKRNLAAGGDNTQAFVLDQTTYKGQFRVYLQATDTRTLKAGDYVYDCWVVLATGEYLVAVENSPFVIKPAITRF